MGDFNAPLSTLNRSLSSDSQQRHSKHKIDSRPMDFLDIYRTFYLTTTEYPFFSPAHGKFSTIDYMLDYKASLNKLKKINK